MLSLLSKKQSIFEYPSSSRRGSDKIQLSPGKEFTRLKTQEQKMPPKSLINLDKFLLEDQIVVEEEGEHKSSDRLDDLLIEASPVSTQQSKLMIITQKKLDSLE